MEAIFPKTALKIAIWVFFRGLKSKSGYFLGFSKIISNEHTYHFHIKSPPGVCTRMYLPPIVCIVSPVVCTRPLTSRYSYVFVSCTTPTRMYSLYNQLLATCCVPLNVYSPSAIIAFSLLNSILLARFLKQSFAQTCLKETDNGKLHQFNY